ncbi:hypothetical protein [Blastococcus sp. PRF04-17]|uniref:hypothetical protein n=1 Tax=Blastococcus sp. PRF04-17 TaxID=2933797 RepID=UPI001FF498F4|nr:hypothetical protein [Blastococcus sp. PRF04-17]UOY00095.1 hypothetical protein MVA48_13830 [Blastococcus sp. PRF04-17]
MVWIALILVLALAGGVLGTLLEVALWAVVLMVVGFALLGLAARAILSSPTRNKARL